MRIAVNTECLVKDGMDGIGRYAHELLKHIVLQHPEHEFLFLFAGPFDASFIYASNVKAAMVSPRLKNNLVFRYGYDIKLAAAIKKFGANLFIGFDGIGCLTTKLPQVLVLGNLSFMHHSGSLSRKQRWFHKLYQQKFIDKATQVAVPSLFVQQNVVKQYQTPSEKISIVLPAASQSFVPVTATERLAIQETYTEGREYFLYMGNGLLQHDLLNVLKAFSIFKKWQQSHMKLVCIGRFKDAGLLEKLKTYRHRNDVVLLDASMDGQLQQLLASCYALIYPSTIKSLGLPVLDAMQCGVPVITGTQAGMQQLGDEAVLYAEPSDIEAMASHLQKLYKDENFRSQLIKDALEQVGKFSWQSSAGQLYKMLEASASK